MKVRILLLLLVAAPLGSAPETTLKSVVLIQETVKRSFKKIAKQPQIVTTRTAFYADRQGQREEVISSERHNIIVTTATKMMYWNAYTKRGNWEKTTAEQRKKLPMSEVTRGLTSVLNTKQLRKIRTTKLLGQNCDVYQGKALVGKGSIVWHVVAEGPLKGFVMQSSNESQEGSVITKTIKLQVNGSIPATMFAAPKDVKLKAVPGTKRKKGR